jgi:hypothetical protein
LCSNHQVKDITLAIQIEYEQLLEEIRTHNTQLLTLDTVFIPVFIGFIIYGITQADDYGSFLGVLDIMLLVYVVFFYICCRAAYIVETLRARVLEIERGYGLKVHFLYEQKILKFSEALYLHVHFRVFP